MTCFWYWSKTYRMNKISFLRHQTLIGPYSAKRQSTYFIINKRCYKKNNLPDFRVRLLKKSKNSNHDSCRSGRRKTTRINKTSPIMMCLLAYLITFKTESQEASISTECCDSSAQILARESIF